jgi:hypothetical protein
MVGGANEEVEGPASESEWVAVKGLLRECAAEVVLRGVLCSCFLGDAGDEGGLDSCVGARANLAFFVAVGGGVLRWKVLRGERSLLREE